MCVSIEKEQVVAGFINRNKNGMFFTLDDVDAYILSLWNAGCGPIRLNFKRQELYNYLFQCNNICLRINTNGFIIDKSFLSSSMTEEEKDLFHGNEELAKSFDLFCKLHVDIRTPHHLLDAMGYHYIYSY